MKWTRKKGGCKMMTNFHGKTVRALACLVFASMAPVLPGFAQGTGLTALKLGWTYRIGFPGLQDSANPGSGIAPGVYTYRVLAVGGDQWYRLQKVVKHPNGGWVSSQGSSGIWVNLSYAFWVQEAVH
jgi:hypothetical protein